MRIQSLHVLGPHTASTRKDDEFEKIKAWIARIEVQQDECGLTLPSQTELMMPLMRRIDPEQIRALSLSGDSELIYAFTLMRIEVGREGSTTVY